MEESRKSQRKKWEGAYMRTKKGFTSDQWLEEVNRLEKELLDIDSNNEIDKDGNDIEEKKKEIKFKLDKARKECSRILKKEHEAEQIEYNKEKLRKEGREKLRATQEARRNKARQKKLEEDEKMIDEVLANLDKDREEQQERVDDLLNRIQEVKDEREAGERNRKLQEIRDKKKEAEERNRKIQEIRDKKKEEEERNRKIQEIRDKKKEEEEEEKNRKKQEINDKKKEEALQVVKKKTIFKRIGVAIAAVAVSIASAIGSLNLFARFRKNEKMDKDNIQTISDTLQPTTNEIESNTEVQEDLTEPTIKENKEPSWVLSDDIQKDIQKTMEDFINNQQKESLQLGSVLQLPEGMEFSETVMGGRTAKIGNKLSPKDGIYVVDHVAQVSESDINNTYGLEGQIENTVPNSKQFVHVSYVPGAKSVEEAKQIIEQQKENAKNGVVDKNIISPRGWVSQDTIENIYKNQQDKQVESQQER